MNITEQLRAAVRAALVKKTQKEIADTAGIHVISLSRFLGGKRDFTIANLELLAGAIGFTIELRKPKKSAKIVVDKD